jgi:hypothetical protein
MTNYTPNHTNNPFEQEDGLDIWLEKDPDYRWAKLSAFASYKSQYLTSHNWFMTQYLKLLFLISKHAIVATAILIFTFLTLTVSAAELLAPQAYKPSQLTGLNKGSSSSVSSQSSLSAASVTSSSQPVGWKHFENDAVAFDYPSDWSVSDAQGVILTKDNYTITLYNFPGFFSPFGGVGCNPDTIREEKLTDKLKLLHLYYSQSCLGGRGNPQPGEWDSSQIQDINTTDPNSGIDKNFYFNTTTYPRDHKMYVFFGVKDDTKILEHDSILVQKLAEMKDIAKTIVFKQLPSSQASSSADVKKFQSNYHFEFSYPSAWQSSAMGTQKPEEATELNFQSPQSDYDQGKRFGSFYITVRPDMSANYVQEECAKFQTSGGSTILKVETITVSNNSACRITFRSDNMPGYPYGNIRVRVIALDASRNQGLDILYDETAKDKEQIKNFEDWQLNQTFVKMVDSLKFL